MKNTILVVALKWWVTPAANPPYNFNFNFNFRASINYDIFVNRYNFLLENLLAV